MWLLMSTPFTGLDINISQMEVNNQERRNAYCVNTNQTNKPDKTTTKPLSVATTPNTIKVTANNSIMDLNECTQILHHDKNLQI